MSRTTPGQAQRHKKVRVFLKASPAFEFPSKKSVTLTFQKLAGLSGVDVKITGHVCRVTGVQAMAVAGIELWLIQAFCRWGSRAVLEYVRDCQLASATDLAVRVAKGVQLTEVRQHLRTIELHCGALDGGGHGACLRRSIGRKCPGLQHRGSDGRSG